MAFIPAKRVTVAFPVSFSVYDEAGKVQKIEFVAQYSRHSLQAFHDLQDSVSNRYRAISGQDPIERTDGTTVPEWKYTSDLDFVVEKVTGWSGIQDAPNVPRAFSADSLLDLLADYPELLVPLFNGFFEAHRGARQKN